MKLFGIYKSIEYIERQLNNIEYATNKEDIRNYGSNSLILVESILKELLHIYGYTILGPDYKKELLPIVDVNDKLMFGKSLNSLRKLHMLLRDPEITTRFNNLFKRNYIVFRYKDIYFDKLIACSETRAILLHDLIQTNATLESYKSDTIESIKKALESLKYFRENNIFPAMILFDNYQIEDNIAICNFKDEIGATIPIRIKNYEVEEIKDKAWYIFKSTNRDLLVPVFNKLNHLIDEDYDQNKDTIVGFSDKDKTVMPLGYLLINDTNERIPIIYEDITIGRLKDNDFIFERRSISRNHCIIKVVNNNIFIMDLNSTFGSFVNGEKIDSNTKHYLKNKDEISIGIGVEEVKFTYFQYRV